MGRVRSESKQYRWYVLGVLALTYAFNFMDRQILSILLGQATALPVTSTTGH